ncbi:MAG: hypothetical protein KXJ50_13650 [Vulcanococcus sp.]|jgi:hypothetical protein|uniref:hypothetical protein n=1 Tax=Vulcanococcus sp. TaxID=2856995 RepID=UPI0025FD84E4|nr:hypothetical protein [Vulcanococcus sp.]MBW0175082.1 hypothetical protein [Vulcanococcus sp.]MBW0182103.1 hypothetical protein [Vulcanococcus sp.]
MELEVVLRPPTLPSPSSAPPLDQAEWKVVRLPSALDLARSGERRRPWLSRSEEEAKQEARLARVRRENGIPSPDEWMW